MIQRTKEEIEAKISELWSNGVETVKVEIEKEKVTISLSNMYSAPGLNFKQMIALSEFFGTTNINDGDKWSNRGCETCDYGSDYGFELTITPEPKCPHATK